NPIYPAKAADRLALGFHICQARMPFHRIAHFLQLAVDAPLGQFGLIADGIKENVDVFGKSIDQVPALRQARASLEDHLVAGKLRDDAERLRDEVVFLDQALLQAKMLGGRKNGLIEILVLEESHAAASSACHAAA